MQRVASVRRRAAAVALRAASAEVRASSSSAAATVDPRGLDMNFSENPHREELTLDEAKAVIAKRAKTQPPGRISFCRCWRSQRMPYCDGRHKQLNRAIEDKSKHVGPVVIFGVEADAASAE